MFHTPRQGNETFLVKAKGDSMEPRIYDGDLVLVKKQQIADSGEIVVCINDEEALIKKLLRMNKTVMLMSLNSNYQPFLPAEDFRIEGVVTGIISRMALK